MRMSARFDRRRSASATGSVYLSSVCATTSGQRKLFHDVRNVRIPSVASAGPQSGRITEKKIRSSPAPSMRAASMKSFGTVSKNCFIRKVPNAVIMPGNMMPQ